MSRSLGSRAALLIAALVTIALVDVVPFGRYVMYPFTLLATWVHEMGHGLAALAVGGHFDKLEIFRDASGRAFTAEAEGLPVALVCVGGLLAPPLVGALWLAIARGPRRARLLLGLLAIALLASALVWVRSVVGLVTVPLLGLAIGAVAIYGGDGERLFLAQFIATVLGFDTATRMLHYVFIERVTEGAVAGSRSDIAGVAESLGGPYWMWGLVVAGVALGMLAAGLYAAWREPKARR